MQIMTPRGALFLCLLLPTFTAAQSHTDNEQLRDAYAGKILTMRRFYDGAQLDFTADGALKSEAVVGPWTLNAQLLVNEIHLRDGKLQVQGRRLHLYYDSKTKEFRDYLTVIENLPPPDRKGLEEVEKSLRELGVRIEIDLPSANPDWPIVAGCMNAVFRAPGEPMAHIVPPYWRLYFAQKDGLPQEVPKPTVAKTEHVPLNGTVTPPSVVFNPSPAYADDARKSKYQGTSRLHMIVAEDGSVHDLQIVLPLGLGLDEKAVDAVSTWKFEPARKGGQPVAVVIEIEVDFRLY